MGNRRGAERTCTDLLLRILHPGHGGGPALHAQRVALGAGVAVGLPRVGAAGLGLRVRVVAQAVQLGPLHHHGIHRTALG